MKLYLLILGFLFFNHSTFAQKKIDGFLGLKFGASKAQVIAALKAKGLRVDIKSSKPNALIFNDVYLGKRKAAFLVAKFVQGKLYEGGFIFNTDLDSERIDFYNALKEDIDGVYGEGKSYKKFKSPYYDGDGYEINAIKSGNAEYNTYWIESEEGGNGINLSITETVFVYLSYQDSVMIKLAIQEEKEQLKSDL